MLRRACDTSITWVTTPLPPTSSTSPCATPAFSPATPSRWCAIKEQRREGLSRRSWDSPLRWRLSPGTWSSRNHPLDVREFALEAAREATAVLETSTDLETSALVAQIRSTATDLLQAAGLGSDKALKALGEASRLGSRE